MIALIQNAFSCLRVKFNIKTDPKISLTSNHIILNKHTTITDMFV